MLNTPWDEAFSTWQRLHRAAEEASRRFDAAGDAYDAAKPSDEELSKLVGSLSPIGPASHIFAISFDAELEWERFLAGESKLWFARDPIAYKRRFREKIDAIVAWCDAERLARKQSGYDAAAAASDDAWSLESKARQRLMATPAPTREAALWKLEELFGPEQLDERDGGVEPWTALGYGSFFDDVRRFLANERTCPRFGGGSFRSVSNKHR